MGVRKWRHYSIYTLTDPRNDSVYYVGCTINTRRRKWQHNSGADTTSASWYTSRLLEIGLKPRFKIVDEIDTAHKELALKLEACWRKVMRDKYPGLINDRETGYLGWPRYGLERAADIKRFAFDDNLDAFHRFEVEEAIKMPVNLEMVDIFDRLSDDD